MANETECILIYSDLVTDFRDPRTAVFLTGFRSTSLGFQILANFSFLLVAYSKWYLMHHLKKSKINVTFIHSIYLA